MTASTSTSVTASWRLSPKDSRNGIIRGFKLFINKKGSGDRPDVQFIDVSNASLYKKTVTGLQGSTEYELQVLAYTSAGDGPPSSIQVVKTKEAGKSYIIFRRIDVRRGPRVNFLRFCSMIFLFLPKIYPYGSTVVR